MKILAVGDLHCRPQYLNDFLKVKEQILITVEKHKPDIVVLLGDTLHNHSQVHTDAFNAVYGLVKSLAVIDGLRTYMLIGNHDYRSNSEFCTENHPFNSFKNYVNVVDKPVMLIADKLHRIAFMPYVPPGRFAEAFAFVSEDKPEIIFAHQEFKRADFGIVSQHGDEWDMPIPVISGHIHDKQVLKNNIMYVGTPYMTTFGESEDKTVCMLHLGRNKKDGSLSVKKEEIVLDVPKRVTLRRTVDTATEGIIATSDYIRVIVSDEAAKILSFKKSNDYKKLQDMGVKVVLEATGVDNHVTTTKETYLDILRVMTKDDEKLSALLREIINA